MTQMGTHLSIFKIDRSCLDFRFLNFLTTSSDLCREAARAALTRQLGADSAKNALRSCVERSGGRLVARKRLPRHCSAAEVSKTNW